MQGLCWRTAGAPAQRAAQGSVTGGLNRNGLPDCRCSCSTQAAANNSSHTHEHRYRLASSKAPACLVEGVAAALGGALDGGSRGIVGGPPKLEGALRMWTRELVWLGDTAGQRCASCDVSRWGPATAVATTSWRWDGRGRRWKQHADAGGAEMLQQQQQQQQQQTHRVGAGGADGEPDAVGLKGVHPAHGGAFQEYRWPAGSTPSLSGSKWCALQGNGSLASEAKHALLTAAPYPLQPSTSLALSACSLSCTQLFDWQPTGSRRRWS